MNTSLTAVTTTVEPVLDAIQDEDIDDYREELQDVLIVDTDVHMDDTLSHLGDYLTGHHRKRLEALLASDFKGEPGNSLRNMIAHVAHLGSTYDKPPRARLANKEELAARLQNGLIDYSILYPSELLPIGYLPDVEWTTALVSAYNNFMIDCYGGMPGVRLVIIINPNAVDHSVAEIQRHAGNPHVVAIAPSDIGVNPPIGNERYRRIFAAAAESNLPMIFHGTEALLHQNYPLRVANFKTLMEVYTVGFPFTAMLQMMSVVCEGIPARFPTLRFGILEAGLTWLPFIMYRTDAAYRRHRTEMPSLERMPSEYMREWYVGTHELESLPRRGDLAKLIDLYQGEDTTMFASDWPHQERDLIGGVMRYDLSHSLRRKILGENAARLFGLANRIDPIPPGA